MAKTTAVNNFFKYFATNITETRNIIQVASSLVGELLQKHQQEIQNLNMDGRGELQKISIPFEKMSQ